MNNPVLAFLDGIEHEELLNEATEDVFLRFKTWCSMNNYKYEFQQPRFTTEVKKITGFETKKKRTPVDEINYRKKPHYWIYVPRKKAKEHK